MPQLADVPGSIPGRVLENFQVTYSFCPHSIAQASTQFNKNDYQGISPGSKVRPAREADNSAVLAVPNVEVEVTRT